MKPVNAQERKKTYRRFLLFFILTMAVMFTAMFFGIRVPYKENSKLQEQLTMAENENKFRENFARTMTETQNLLDSVNQNPATAGLVDGRITQKIQEMDAMLNKNETGSKTLYSQIIRSMNNTQSDKKGLRAAGNKDSVVAMYNTQIQELKNSLTKWQDSYRQLETQNMMLRQR